MRGVPVRYGLGREGRFGRPAGKLLPVLGLATAKRALRCTENPRVGGSIPPLATTPNFLKRMSFPASPADYRRPPGPKPADHRTSGNRVDASAGSRRRCGRRVRRRPRCGTVASGVGARGAPAGRAWRPPWAPPARPLRREGSEFRGSPRSAYQSASDWDHRAIYAEARKFKTSSACNAIDEPKRRAGSDSSNCISASAASASPFCNSSSPIPS